MEKEVVWTAVAQKDFWEIVAYLSEAWPKSVLDRFHGVLSIKIHLLQKQPQIGFRSKKYSKYRRTLVTRHYALIYFSK
ncbi:MAG: type II toxin-antitoxin system RelE/ParE family toxin [Niastella sp.]|uniref:type II toxin-antitoxin system RelE/ParE family toxin n=1 Tax=Niastella sp. TaxID=1869183 RepID=UPI003899C05E